MKQTTNELTQIYEMLGSNTICESERWSSEGSRSTASFSHSQLLDSSCKVSLVLPQLVGCFEMRQSAQATRVQVRGNRISTDKFRSATEAPEPPHSCGVGLMTLESWP